jgi:hypothetical protein
LLAQLTHQLGSLCAFLASQRTGPLRVLDNRPGDSFVVERAGFIDMRRKHDADRALGRAGQIAARDPGAHPRCLNSGRRQVPELSSRALVDHMGGCAIALGCAAGKVALDVGAEAHAAA